MMSASPATGSTTERRSSPLRRTRMSRSPGSRVARLIRSPSSRSNFRATSRRRQGPATSSTAACGGGRRSRSRPLRMPMSTAVCRRRTLATTPSSGSIRRRTFVLKSPLQRHRVRPARFSRSRSGSSRDTSGLAAGYDVRGVADTTWGESTITYANAPSDCGHGHGLLRASHLRPLGRRSTSLRSSRRTVSSRSP